jgi:alpha-maltose-1-phosphate synthase
MRVDLLSREYPPEVYGGAGVHIEYLARELRRLADVRVRCFGVPRGEPDVEAYRVPGGLETANPALQVLGVGLEIAAACEGADVVHSHTWYAALAGHAAKLLYGVPLVATTHSLEPLRPWKAEQLGGGYALSSWAERVVLDSADAIIAVSEGMRRDVLTTYPEISPDKVRVIHNGIDTDEYAPAADATALARHGIDPDRPYVIFVGRITRQKGLVHLLRAARSFDPGAQLVLCAGSPDTPEIAGEVRELITGLQRSREGVIWIPEMVPRAELIQLLSHATAFVCPSVYEPMGIVNLEAMACETAVVATATGGIPEVVADRSTGFLVPIDQGADGEPYDPEAFAAGIAEHVNAILGDRELAAALGKAGRQRAIEHFSWRRIAQQTVDLYASLRP